MKNASTTPPASAPPPIACSLGEAGQVNRVQQWEVLVTRATARVSLETGLRLTFPADPALTGELAELAVREQQCCEFFRFTVTIASCQEVIFEVNAPPEALGTVVALFGPRQARLGRCDPDELFPRLTA
ncbi:MAG: hypothetical protein ACR2GX_04855 [Candidatus Dormibacteria bacterium]